MPLTGRWTRLGEWTMNNLPKEPGVYELANVTQQVIFLGGCQNLDLRLHQHLYSKDPCLSRAWHFKLEASVEPEKRLNELLDEYQKEHGKLPDCQR